VKAALAGTGEAFKKGTLLDGTPPQNARAQSLDNRFDLPLPRQYDLPFSNVQLIPGRLDEPLHWRKPRTVFVCPQSDLFHEQVSDEFISWVFAAMSMAPGHRFLLLTKRAERMHQYLTEMSTNPDAYVWAWAHETSNVFLDGAPAPSPTEVWPLPNVYLGVSVENQHWADQRIPLLLDTPGKHWVSIEPMLGPVDLTKIADTDESWIDALGGKRYSTAQHVAIRPKDAPRLSWLVVGGESGPGYRPMELAWAKDIADQCTAARVPFYFKQIAANRPGQPSGIPMLDIAKDMPAALGVSGDG
jgi:protein gp37